MSRPSKHHSARPMRLALALAGAGLVSASGCASFDSLLGKGYRSEAQEHLTTEAQFRRLVAAYDLGDLRVGVRRLERARGLRPFEAPARNDELAARMAAILDRTALYTFAADGVSPDLQLEWRIRGAGVQLLTGLPSPRAFASITGEAPPAECHQELRQPNVPALARIANPVLRKVPPWLSLAETSRMVIECPSRF
ncbi:MAG: hypothetical protein K8W52_37365, partial [Deltaproteobacteria bacterium]|nr:hypothetical protein [Deltaproteobacteria bacterium]